MLVDLVRIVCDRWKTPQNFLCLGRPTGRYSFSTVFAGSSQL